VKSWFILSSILLGALFGVVVCGTAAHAGEIGLKGIEARIGLVDIEGDAGSTFGLSATADLGTLGSQIGLEAGIDFWNKGWDAGVPGSQWSYSWTNVALLVSARYNISTEGSFKPFAFAGLGFHLWKWSSEYDGAFDEWWGDIDSSGSDIEFGVHFGVGAEMAMSPSMNLVGRAGYNSNGGADYLFIQGGVKFLMGKK
jgi:opacity protein-like surface antigen